MYRGWTVFLLLLSTALSARQICTVCHVYSWMTSTVYLICKGPTSIGVIIHQYNQRKARLVSTGGLRLNKTILPCVSSRDECPSC